MSTLPMLTSEQLDELAEDAEGLTLKQLIEMSRFALKASAEWQGADGKADALERENQRLRRSSMARESESK